MAKTETAPVVESDDAGVFSLTDDFKALITRKSTREVTPSIFLEQVKTANVNAGEAYGIKITPERTVSTIMSNLEKAQKALGIKLKVWQRPDAPVPFVGYQVKTATPAEADQGETTEAAPEVDR
jgi:hypothetical protein